jgi:hypothetical protein
LLSYCEPNSSGTGTDISELMDCREDDDCILQRHGKGATTAQSVAYSTDHLVFTTSEAGDQYQFGFTSAVTASGGTDIITGLTVGLSGADVILDSLSITAGQTVTINSAVFTHAA